MPTSPRLVYTPSPGATLDLDALHLERGSHQDPDSGLCMMEAASLFAGEKHTDHPDCVSPLLANVGIRLNDRATDTQRQGLKRFIPLVVGTAGDGNDDARRWLAVDRSVRFLLPKYLDLLARHGQASILRALPPIIDADTYRPHANRLRTVADEMYELRRNRYGTIRAAVRKAVKDKPAADAGADAGAGADADAVAVAVAVAVAGAIAAADAVAVAGADAVADAAAVAAAGAGAIADAAAGAVAAAVAGAVAAAGADAVAVAGADAGADAAADAAAVAAADAGAGAVAAADADADDPWNTTYEAVYAKVKPIYQEKCAGLTAESWVDAVALYADLIDPAKAVA